MTSRPFATGSEEQRRYEAVQLGQEPCNGVTPGGAPGVGVEEQEQVGDVQGQAEENQEEEGQHKGMGTRQVTLGGRRWIERRLLSAPDAQQVQVNGEQPQEGKQEGGHAVDVHQEPGAEDGVWAAHPPVAAVDLCIGEVADVLHVELG